MKLWMNGALGTQPSIPSLIGRFESFSSISTQFSAMEILTGLPAECGLFSDVGAAVAAKHGPAPQLLTAILAETGAYFV